MLKNQKLGTKIAFGFVIVLVLTVIVGYIGFRGLGKVTSSVNTADDADRLIKYVLNARKQEKNFMLRGASFKSTLHF